MDDVNFYFWDICLRIIAGKYGKPDATLWANKDYLILSNILFKQTGVQISPSTLKRIFGKSKTTERYFPQKATRDTLAQYAGFENWEDFEQKNKKEEQEKSVAAITELPPVKKNKNNIRIFFIALTCIVAGLIAVVIWQYNKKNSADHIARLICLNPVGKTPHTAIFKMKLSGKPGNDDAFSIDFGDGHPEPKIEPGGELTHYYEVPGRYYAVLNRNGLPCDTVPVYLTTDDWTATANMKSDTTRVYPVRITDFDQTDVLSVNARNVWNAGVDTSKTFWISFVNSKPLNINGDNFSLNLYLHTSKQRPGVRCSQVDVTVFGEKSKDHVTFIMPGCIAWSDLNFSEISYSGQHSDLGFLGCDLTGGGKIAFLVRRKEVRLSINDKMVFKTSYTFPLKKIYGISVMFAGIGSIEQFLLKDLSTDSTFSGGFSQKAN